MNIKAGYADRRSDFVETSKTLAEYARRDFSHITDTVFRARFPDSYQYRPLVAVPFLAHLVEQMSPWYRRPPVRRFMVRETGRLLAETNGGQRAALDRLYRGLRVDRRLLTVNEALVHQRTVILGVLPIPGTSRYSIRVWLPYEAEVDPDPLTSEDIQRAKAIRLRVPLSASHERAEFGDLVLTPEQIYYGSGADKVSPWNIDPDDLSNPFPDGAYPLAVARLGTPAPGDFFCELPDDLYHAQTEMCVGLSDSIHGAAYGTWGQKWIKSESRKEFPASLTFGQDVLVTLGEGEEMGILSPASQVEKYLSVIQQVTDYERLFNSLPGSTSKGALTAIAKMMDRLETDSARQAYQTALRDAEQGVYDVLSLALNHNFGLGPQGNPWPAAGVEVDYQEPAIPIDPLHAAQSDRMRLEDGLTSPDEIVARERGITLAEARTVVDANIARYAALRRAKEGATDGTPQP